MFRTARTLRAAVLLAVAAPAAADTVRFDITELDLGIFGVQYTADYLGPHDGLVTSATAHLVYHSGSFAAENILLQFEAPVGPGTPAYPLWELSGASLGWSGAGAFTADRSTTELNGRILDGNGQPGSFSLWFLRILNSAGTLPIGGQFVGSYFEIEYTPIPSPAAAAPLAMMLFAIRRRRR